MGFAMADCMKASVIMNTFNEEREVLAAAINSYLCQEGCEIELIISTIEGDENIDFVLANYPATVVWMKKEDHPGKSPLGSFMQLNNALPYITGEWFCFASSNDVAFPRKIITEIECCIQNGKEVCYSSYTMSGKPVRFHDYDFKKHLNGNFVSDCALVSERLVDKYLPFKTEYKNYAYWDLWLRIYEGEGNVFHYNPQPTWNYKQDPESMHIKRRGNPELVAEAQKDREYMLSFHNGIELLSV